MALWNKTMPEEALDEGSISAVNGSPILEEYPLFGQHDT